MDKTTRVPKSVLRYELDKVRSHDLETSLSQSCSPKKVAGSQDRVKCLLDRRFKKLGL